MQLISVKSILSSWDQHVHYRHKGKKDEEFPPWVHKLKENFYSSFGSLAVQDLRLLVENNISLSTCKKF